MKIRETPAFTSTKEELSKEKHPFNSKAGSVCSAWPQQPCREGLGDTGGVEQTWVSGWCFRGWLESFGSVLFNTQPDFICLLCITTIVLLQNNAGVIQPFLPSGHPVWFQPTRYTWCLLPEVLRAGKWEFYAFVSTWTQIPLLVEGHFQTHCMTKWIQESAGHTSHATYQNMTYVRCSTRNL